MNPDQRHSPAAERNREPIVRVLRGWLSGAPRVLEIGSGTGQHALYFTDAWPTLVWQPTEASPEGLASIAAYRREALSDGFLAPVSLDVLEDAFPEGPWDAVFSANVIHIAPLEVCGAIVAGAARSLGAGGHLILYGPFRVGGVLSPESNVAFDAHLRGRDPRWGIRDLEDVTQMARDAGFGPPEVADMPANNHCVHFIRT